MALIPFDDRDGTIWLNGEMLPWRDAKTHTLSHGLHYASLVFEGERVYSGTIFKGREHTERLRNSCKIMDFDIPLSDDEVDMAKSMRRRWRLSKPTASPTAMCAPFAGVARK